MTIEGIYYFGDQLRWNLGWPNPNPAGAFIAMCLMFFFAGQLCFRRECKRRWKLFGALLLVIEFGMWFLLCKTYSRGALLAAVVCMFLYFLGLLVLRPRSLSRCSSCAALMIRACLLGILLWCTGFFGRIDPEFVVQDASVTNRTVLWKGGLQMLWHKPLRGWGIGESGKQFMHWFQPIDASEKYAGMVNSYLHVGVERGLPILMLCLGGLLFFVCLVCIITYISVAAGRSVQSVLAGVSAASIGVFLIANIFNTLWIFSRLWIPVGLAASVILILSLLSDFKKCLVSCAQSCLLSFVSSMLVALGLWLIGGMFASASTYRLRFEGDTVILQNEASGGGATREKWILAMDPVVYGDDWGKEVRRLVNVLQDRSIELLVPPVQSDGIVFTEAWKSKFLSSASGVSVCRLMISGPICPPIAFASDVDQLIWMHPRDYNECHGRALQSYEGGILFFPMMDFTGDQGKWKRQSAATGWTVDSSGAFLEDIRAKWPGCLVHVMK